MITILLSWFNILVVRKMATSPPPPHPMFGNYILNIYQFYDIMNYISTLMDIKKGTG